ncbi:uncharacterized protein LOC119547456 [Drosophila subpulchrella]|uniref:uncharacterized protein LOC119547456 n=1 Tax=Drosophila subpulchrella TaxID=1486046 RepID=UPI0018A158B6|nr:uncharacterized protein LOC119547456 [Drosophila subpulchrella]
MEEPANSKYAFQSRLERIFIEDAVSSCDDFPRPRGSRKAAKFQRDRVEPAEDGDNVPRERRVKRPERKNKLKITKSRKRPSTKVTARKRAASANKAQQPKATGIPEPSVKRSTSLRSEIYKEPFWWNLFGTKQMEKEAKSSEMSTQTKLTSRYLKKNM